MTKCLFVLLIILNRHVFAQSDTYTNQVFLPDIRSVEFYNASKQGSFPVINLKTNGQVLLAFDDLRGGSRSYYYTLEHCDENWNSSNLAAAEYLQGFTDDRIIDYSYSLSTLQKYTHYQLKLPNDNIKPKIAGNYVLKVYEDEDPNRLILTRRLYVLNERVLVTASVVPPAEQSLRKTHQKINFQLDCPGLNLQNPSNDLHTLVLQNACPETVLITTEPALIRGTQLIYDDLNSNLFPGGNEFRHVDLRSLKLNSDRVAKIVRDTANSVILLTDVPQRQPDYTQTYDLDGGFVPANQDGNDPRVDADYAHVLFSLAATNRSATGAVYVVGQFNGYQLSAGNQLYYDSLSHRYISTQLIKQGITDYTYLWVDATGKADLTALEGSHFETENDYQLLVYYHPAGARWTELVGYKLLNTVGNK
jgi:hypothetical protein